MEIIITNLIAQNDVNGNPRKLVHARIKSIYGESVVIVDQGFEGTHRLFSVLGFNKPQMKHHIVENGTFHITTKEYNRLLKNEFSETDNEKLMAMECLNDKDIHSKRQNNRQLLNAALAYISRQVKVRDLKYVRKEVVALEVLGRWGWGGNQ